jgi:hypothetical protein
MNPVYIGAFIAIYFAALTSIFTGTYSPNILSICENIFSILETRLQEKRYFKSSE